MRKVLIGLALLFALAAGIWYATRPRPVTVALAEIARGTVEETVANTRAGTVEACRRARLAPTMGGQIAKLYVAEGDVVEAGQLLLEMWNHDLAAEKTLAQRDAVAARARADEACTTASVAAREAARIARLRERGLSSEEDADRSDGNARAVAAACAAARASVSVTDARILITEAALERTQLRAPFAGTVAEINGELGEFVTPSPVGIPTPPAIDLIDDSCLYITAPIDEVDAPAIRAGLPARIALDAFGNTRFPGRVRRVAPYVLDVEKQARTVKIEIDIENPDARLLPGYSADVEVILDTRNDVLRVPTQALLAGNRVLVFDAASARLEERAVDTGVRSWQYTEVLGGLAAGERVVLSIDREGVEPGALAQPE